MGSIYMITNKLNNKKYIGQTKREVSERLKEHLEIAYHTKRNLHLYNAMRKYGIENFEVTILKTDLPENKLDEWEIYYIGKYDTLENGYNNTAGGGGIRGYHHTQETKNKISKSVRENPERYTKERAQKISYALKGKKLTEEHKKHLSEARKGKYTGYDNGFYMKHHTKESKQKMHDSSIRYYVQQIDLDTNSIINVFDCVEDASKYCIEQNYTKAKLSSVMYRIYYTGVGNQKSAYGFGWRYQERCNDYPTRE